MNENNILPQTNALSALTAQMGLVDRGELYNVLRATVIPQNASDEQLAAFAMVAAQYKLNPLTKEIYAFPAKGGGVTPMISIDGWLKLLHCNPDFDGMEHAYAEDGSWVECRIYSKRYSRPIVAREYREENEMKGSPVWSQRPRRMLKHRATIQAIRYFGNYGGLVDKEEAEEAEMRNVTREAQAPKLFAEPCPVPGVVSEPPPAVEVDPVQETAPVQGAQVFEQRGFDMFGEEVQA